MNAPWGSLLATARWAARVLIVGLALLPVLIVTAASVPALLVLPFSRRRSAQAAAIVRQLTAWTRALLAGSRER
ncbi:dTMP kinase [Streptomyces sp. NPDC089919]|uniref:dTMP kinase n=1 Tax=Streptomyces sp. NPDC089919 TaxID=3155188 RepID=UPI003439124A